jgi:hypothetical protein
MPAPTPEEITNPIDEQMWRNLSRLFEDNPSSYMFVSELIADKLHCVKEQRRQCSENQKAA